MISRSRLSLEVEIKLEASHVTFDIEVTQHHILIVDRICLSKWIEEYPEAGWEFVPCL